MATVTGMTADAIKALVNNGVINGEVTTAGAIQLTRRSGEVLNIGSVATQAQLAATNDNVTSNTTELNDHESRLDVLETVAVGWTDITAFSNSWGVTSSGFARFKIDSAGNLHIQAMLHTVGTSGQTAFNIATPRHPDIPSGKFLKLTGSQSATAGNVRINVGPVGDFTIFYDGTPSYVSMNIVIASA